MALDDASRTIVEVVDGDVVLATVAVDCPSTPDLTVVATLARLHLTTRRMGWNVRIENPSPELCDLLRFVGLDDLLLQP